MPSPPPITDGRVTFTSEHCGFPDVVQGGYLSGFTANLLGEAATVRLKRPTRPDTLLTVEHDNGKVQLRDDGDVCVAAGRLRDEFGDPPTPPDVLSHEEAAKLQRAAAEASGRTYETCVACGLGRTPGAGLRLAVGPVGDDICAGRWTPHESLGGPDGVIATELAWALLDCPGLWALHHAGSGRAALPLVTAAFSAQYDRPLVAGKTYIVLGWPAGSRGPALRAGAAVLEEDFTVVGRALQTCMRADWGFDVSSG